MLGLAGADDVVVVVQVGAIAGAAVDVVVTVSAVVIVCAVVVVVVPVVGERAMANACIMFCCDMVRSRCGCFGLGVANGGTMLVEVAGAT